MGFYIQGKEYISKEKWLYHHAKVALEQPPPFDKEDIPLCLVNNGPFTALAVAYSENEMQAFTQPEDPRPKVWFTAKRDVIEKELGLKLPI